MKLKKTLLLVLSVLTLSALVLTGCGKENANPQTPPANQPGASASGEAGGQSVQSDSLMTVAELLGKSDAQVKDLFGGGTENRTEDGSILLGRSYATTLDGSAVTLETVYTEEQTVGSVSASFPDQTADEIKAIITGAFGEPQVSDETAELDSKTLTWTKDQVSIVMNESYGMSIVEFMPANG